MVKKGTFRVDIEKEFLEKVAEEFCFAQALGEKVKVRTLSSVCTEAFLKGILLMIDELKVLRKNFGPTVYLKAKGIGFTELRELNEQEDDEKPN